MLLDVNIVWRRVRVVNFYLDLQAVGKETGKSIRTNRNETVNRLPTNPASFRGALEPVSFNQLGSVFECSRLWVQKELTGS